MQRTESQENYLEVILMLSKKKPVVRSVDIANELGFKKPSISVAMKHLKELDFITVTPEGYIYLTSAGMQVATGVYEKHQVITQTLIQLGVPSDIAEADACRMEHVISEETFLALKNIWNKNKT